LPRPPIRANKTAEQSALTTWYTSTTLTPISRSEGSDSRYRRISSAPEWGEWMAKIKFTLKGVTNEIRKAEKKLRSIRSKVTEADRKKIDLNLRSLKKSYGIIGIVCRPPTQFGQTFTTKPK
jgi:hypothetical protein